MVKIREKFLLDKKGQRVAVVLKMRQYRKILKNLEELEAIRAYDAAKMSHEEAIPFEQAIKEIEKKRK